MKVNTMVILKDNGYTPKGYELRIGKVVELVNEKVIKVKVGTQIFKLYKEDVEVMKQVDSLEKGQSQDYWTIDIKRTLGNLVLSKIAYQKMKNGQVNEYCWIKENANVARVIKSGKVDIKGKKYSISQFSK